MAEGTERRAQRGKIKKMAGLGSPVRTLRSLVRELRYVSAQAGRPYRDTAAYRHLREAFRAHRVRGGTPLAEPSLPLPPL